MVSAMKEWGEHPSRPLTELEVLVGFIINSRGFQTHRQRDRSIKLKGEFERISGWIMRRMRHANASAEGQGGSDMDALELCLACLHVGCHDGPSVGGRAHETRPKLHSFRIVAASALMREIDVLEMNVRREVRAQGGGFVGVQGGRSTTGQQSPAQTPTFAPAASYEESLRKTQSLLSNLKINLADQARPGVGGGPTRVAGAGAGMTSPVVREGSDQGTGRPHQDKAVPRSSRALPDATEMQASVLETITDRLRAQYGGSQAQARRGRTDQR